MTRGFSRYFTMHYVKTISFLSIAFARMTALRRHHTLPSRVVRKLSLVGSVQKHVYTSSSSSLSSSPWLTCFNGKPRQSRSRIELHFDKSHRSKRPKSTSRHDVLVWNVFVRSLAVGFDFDKLLFLIDQKTFNRSTHVCYQKKKKKKTDSFLSEKIKNIATLLVTCLKLLNNNNWFIDVNKIIFKNRVVTLFHNQKPLFLNVLVKCMTFDLIFNHTIAFDKLVYLIYWKIKKIT